MFAKLEGLEKKYMELEQALAQPDVYNDQDQYRKLTKAHADLRDVVELFRRHRSLTQELEENKQLLHDSDPDIKAAYLLTMNMWHAETVAIIEQGLASGEFRSAEPAADIAWRFIALVCGLDGIYALDAQALDEAAFSRYVNKMITLELF